MIRRSILYGFKILLLFLIWISFLACNQKENISNTLETGYYSLSEYLNKYPKKQKDYDLFRETVQKEAIPIKQGIQLRPVRISMIYPGNEKSDYWTRSVTSFSVRMEQLDIQNRILEFFSRPGLIDQNIQEEQINEALKSDPDYLVFTLDVTRHKELIERIITLGRPKIILQNITTPLKEWEGNQPFLYVGFSHKLGTEKILIPEFLRYTQGKGSYAMLYFTKGFVSEQRGNTFISYMEKNTEMVLKAAYYTDGQFDLAQKATEDLLIEYPDIDFIYACSTSIALAAVKVLEEKGMKTNIFVNGWGGGSAELESILKGDLNFTVMRINDDNGIAMAEAIKLDLQGEKKKIPTVYSGEFVLVNQETTAEELNKLKKRAFRASGE